MPNPILRTGITLLEVLFFAGVVGSVLVVLLTGIEDIRTMFSSEGKEK